MTLPLDLDAIAQGCARTLPDPGGQALLDLLAGFFPGQRLQSVLVRGGWHRLGGVVDRDQRPVARHLLHWAEEESGGDVNQLLAMYGDSGYFATRLAGKTHYLVAVCGAAPDAFIQIEVEEFQEEIDRILIDRDWQPEDLQEFIDPMGDYPRLEPEPVGPPSYHFRRAFMASELVARITSGITPEDSPVHRLLNEWQRSSAGTKPFCHHWVFGVQETLSADGETRYRARPTTTFSQPLELPDKIQGLWGAELANLVSDIDRRVGHPFAWYFLMLSGSKVPHWIGEQVLNDQLGEFDYLPAKDLEVLQQWQLRPYRV